MGHGPSAELPVSPRWRRITDFLKAGGIKGSYGIIGYLQAKGCVFMTPSEHLQTATR